MKKCIKTSAPCIGRDCRDLIVSGNFELCCREEIKEEKEVAQIIIDAIDDFGKDPKGLKTISCKLSYGAHVINQNNQEHLMQVIPVVKRYSELIYEFHEKIQNDCAISDLVCSFTQELQRWFSFHFLPETASFVHPIQAQSIIADMDTIEMALGVCMISDHYEETLDDLFF